MGNLIPAPNPMGTVMGKMSPRLLSGDRDGDRDKKALRSGDQTRCHPQAWRHENHVRTADRCAHL
jgi:hypothetical protein